MKIIDHPRPRRASAVLSAAGVLALATTASAAAALSASGVRRVAAVSSSAFVGAWTHHVVNAAGVPVLAGELVIRDQGARLAVTAIEHVYDPSLTAAGARHVRQNQVSTRNVVFDGQRLTFEVVFELASKKPGAGGKKEQRAVLLQMTTTAPGQGTLSDLGAGLLAEDAHLVRR